MIKAIILNSKILIQMLKESFLEDKDQCYADGDGGVCQVKNRPEKDEPFTAVKREPVRIMTGKNRKIQHIHHFPVQKRGVPPIFGEHTGNLVKTVIKYHTVENAVNDVSQCTCHDKSHTHNESGM